MTIERTGTAVSIVTESTSGSQSVAVPSDCDCAVIFHVAAMDNQQNVFNSNGAVLSLGGQTPTWVVRTPYAESMGSAGHVLINPPTGSQTFSWAGAYGEFGAPIFLFIFYKGVDGTTPIIDSDSAIGSSVGGLTAPVGSMTVFSSQSYQVSVDTSINSQTVILDNLVSGNSRADVAEKAGATGVSSSGGSYDSVTAIVLAQESAVVTLTQHSFRFFNDDGSESGSTAKANINTNINLSANDVARIRMLIDATGDPTGKQFQLEFRRKPSGGSFGSWTEVTQ